MQYRPEIDGLRAIAVIPVILFHAGFETFSGGFTGVDVFFVISGFLITSIISAELEESRFSIISFYERRLRRILPLLLFVLIATLPFAWVSLFQVDMIDYFESLVAIPLFSSNFLFVQEANYFDASVELKPLLHTWSLAVEEQYYLLFPIFMLLVWQFKQKNLLLVLLLVFGGLSFAVSEWASVAHPKHNFYLLPSRAWELAVGVVLAIVSKKTWFINVQRRKGANEVLSALGLLLIAVGFFSINDETPFPGTYALLPTIGTMLVIGFANSENVVGRILAFRMLVFIGLISYSAYMWHHPIIAFYRHMAFYDSTFLHKSALCASVIPLSYLSWRFIERPFRAGRILSRRAVFTYSTFGSLFIIAIGVVGIFFNGFPGRSINTNLNILSYNPDNRALEAESWKRIRKKEAAFGDRSWYDNANDQSNLLLIGNSHSKDMYNSLVASRIASSKFDLAWIGGEIRDFSLPQHDLYSSQNYIEADVIMIVSRYYEDDLAHIEPLVNNLVRSKKIVILVKEVTDFKTINARTKADLIIQDWARRMTQSNATLNAPKLIGEINRAYYREYLGRAESFEAKSDAIIEHIKAVNPEVIVLKRDDYICNDEARTCYAINSSLQKYFYDAKHNTNAGASWFGQRIDEIGWLSPVIAACRESVGSVPPGSDQ